MWKKSFKYFPVITIQPAYQWNKEFESSSLKKIKKNMLNKYEMKPKFNLTLKPECRKLE